MTAAHDPATDLVARYAAAEAAWGDHEPEPELFTSGRWSLERRGDELADIRVDGVVVLRMLRAVARDRDWSTVPSSVASVAATGSRLELGLTMVGLGADLEGTLAVEVDGDTLRVELDVLSRTDFERNRIGLIVLHPPTVAGEPLTVTDPSGSTVSTAFPESISPWQPAKQIAALAWTQGGLAVDLAFAGEVFEMEDQRNWTDASYKTYSTPLDLPFPVLQPAGSRVVQSLTLRAGAAPASAEAAPAITVDPAPAARAVPAIVLGASTAPEPLPVTADPSLPADAVLVELEARARNWPAALERARREAGALPLDVRLVVTEPEQVGPLLDALAGQRLARLGVFSTRTQTSLPELWRALVEGAAARGLRAELVGGARSHFTELNRQHPDLPADLPALVFSVTPQMHAIERAQLVESLAMQRRVATDAVRIAGERPVHVGPVTLRARYNAVATTPPPAEPRDDVADGYAAERVPGATDPRQHAEALAAWTIASAAALSVPGVASIAFFETAGPRGLRDASGAFPVAAALHALHELSGRPALDPTGEVAPGLWVLAAAGERGDMPDIALIANVDAVEQTLSVGGVAVTLPPFGWRRVEL